jgi:hypothetical protein
LIWYCLWEKYLKILKLFYRDTAHTVHVYYYFDICSLQFGVRLWIFPDFGFCGLWCVVWLNLLLCERVCCHSEKDEIIPSKKNKEKKRAVKIFRTRTQHVRTSPTFRTGNLRTRNVGNPCGCLIFWVVCNH